MSVTQPHPVWRSTIIAIGLLLGLIVIFYQQTVYYLLQRWNQLSIGEYGHGYLVLAISAYLIFYNRHRLAVLQPRPTFKAIPAVIAASLFWGLASLLDIAVLQAAGLLLLLLSVVWAVVGSQVMRVLLFPILYIGFAIPIWFPLSPLLQQLTADSVFWVIRVLDVPAYRLDYTIVLPSGRLSIAEACSGLRYLLAALTLGTLYAYLNYSRLSSRLLVVLVFAVTAVLSNLIRVFIVVYLGYSTDMQHPLVDDHLNLGWYVFAALVIILFIVEALIHKRHHPNYDEAVAPHQIAEDVRETSQGKHDTALSFVPVVMVLAVLIITTPLLLGQMHGLSQTVGISAEVSPPEEAGSWMMQASADDGWQLAFHGAHVFRYDFQNPDKQVIHLSIGLYTAQAQGNELVNELNRISDNQRWRLIYRSARRYNTGHQQVFEQLLENRDGVQRLVWYWYRVARHDTVNRYQAKGLQALGLLTGNKRAAVVAIAVDMTADKAEARRALQRFVEDMAAGIDLAVDRD